MICLFKNRIRSISPIGSIPTYRKPTGTSAIYVVGGERTLDLDIFCYMAMKLSKMNRLTIPHYDVIVNLLSFLFVNCAHISFYLMAKN